MCGVTGIAGPYGDRSIQSRNIIKMTATLAHRGPDAWGTYLSPAAALGHTRLSIIDLSGGHQPMASERFVLAYNGEVFNYIELRNELIEHSVRFETTCDTEVVLKCFEQYGVKGALQRFNGQFALLLWDRWEKKLIAARDRFGIRPLYRLKHEGRWYFASEMKAFDVIPGYVREMDVNHMFQHGLFWNTLLDNTVYKGVGTVAAGTFEVYSQEGESGKSERYYEIGETHHLSELSFDEAVASFKSMLEDAVRLRLRSDVPVAAYLSGGIDSSVISHLVASLTRKRFETYSVAFSDEEFDESAYQRLMAKKLGTAHNETRVDYQDINNSFLQAVYHIERPVFRTAPVPLFLLSKRVHADGIKVVVTGEGADEILFGYDSFKELKLLDFWSKFPDSQLRPQLIKRLYPHLQYYKDPKQFGLMKMYYETFLNSYNNELAGLNIRCYNNRILNGFLNKDRDVTIGLDGLVDDIKRILPDNFHSWTLLQKNQFLEMKTLLSGYLLSSQGDRMSMAHSVEGRYPFLDHRLIDLLFSFPDKYKMKVFSQKHLLAKAYEDNIPKSIINRPKRPYMAPDLKSFLNRGEPSAEAGYFLSDEIIDDYGMFDKKMVQRFLKKFKGRAPDQIGYRDNMLVTFILSAQMAIYWAKNPQDLLLKEESRRVEIDDY